MLGPTRSYAGLLRGGGTLVGALTISLTSIAAGTTAGLTMANTTAATAGATIQRSPALKLSGAAWNTTAAGSSSACDWQIQQRMTSGTTVYNHLYFSSQVASGGYVDKFYWLDGSGSYLYSSGGFVASSASSGVRCTGGFDITASGGAAFFDGGGSNRVALRSSLVAGSTSTDVTLQSLTTRTAGNLLSVINNTATKLKVDWAGRLFSTVPNTAVTDGDVGASQMSSYVDEVGHNLKIRVCYADGTTYKLATIALA